MVSHSQHWDEAARAAKRTYTRQMEEFKAGNYSRPEPRKKSSPSTPASRGSKKLVHTHTL